MNGAMLPAVGFLGGRLRSAEQPAWPINNRNLKIPSHKSITLRYLPGFTTGLALQTQRAEKSCRCLQLQAHMIMVAFTTASYNIIGCIDVLLLEVSPCELSLHLLL